MNNDIKNAPLKSMKNRQNVKTSQICGCYQCLATFPSQEITQWTDQNETAICPKCQTDSVLPDSCGISLDENNLKEIKKYWFAIPHQGQN
jgi:hypothetical protein